MIRAIGGTMDDDGYVISGIGTKTPSSKVDWH